MMAIPAMGAGVGAAAFFERHYLSHLTNKFAPPTPGTPRLPRHDGP
jgi:hypothetical protein